jgi:hypothetical protein
MLCNNNVRPFSIEWHRHRQGMEDPFVQLTGQRPSSTTQIPGRDINFILTFGIQISSISTLPLNTPVVSDHLGIISDIDLAAFFSSHYSEMSNTIPCMLSSGNKKSVDSYITHVAKNIADHKLLERVQALYDTVLGRSLISSNSIHFTFKQLGSTVHRNPSSR